MLNDFVALLTLAGLVVATAGCTPLKARDPDPNAGGGSMYRAAAPMEVR